jgi:hypothetical protein
MDASTVLAATILAAAIPAAAPAADAPRERNTTPAEESVQRGSGTASNAATSPPADAGGTTIGSGNDTAGAQGVAVGEGTVMRPFSAQGRNGLRSQPARRKQLYGINPKAAPDAETREKSR